VLGSVLVEEKSNEIPAARCLLEKLGPFEGKIVMLDALHTNQATLRQITQDNGADYLLPVKDNHEGLAHRVAEYFPSLDPPQPAEIQSGSVPRDANPGKAGLSPLGISCDTGTSRRPVRYR
jgi:hypothetical protein